MKNLLATITRDLQEIWALLRYGPGSAEYLVLARDNSSLQD